MTKHRKISKDMSTRCWECGCIEWDDEAVCNLIEAVEEFKRADEETNKCTELLIFDPCTPKAAEIMQAMYKAKDELFAALGKLNEKT